MASIPTVKHTFVSTKGDTWEWEETPEATAAIAALHKKNDSPQLATLKEGPKKKTETTGTTSS